jgi:HTH-like domain
MCHLVGVSRASYYRYGDVVAPDEAEMVARASIQEVVLRHRRRYGYRRVTEDLHRQGMVINHKRVSRITRERPGTCVGAPVRMAFRFDDSVGVPIAIFRSSIPQPICAPVYASAVASQRPLQNSGPSGSLFLSRKALASSTPCRFILAHRQLFLWATRWMLSPLKPLLWLTRSTSR